jgi:glutathione S-transferase
VPHSVGECFDLIEREMFEVPWVMGEIYTICDPVLFTLAQLLEGDGVDRARVPKILGFRSRMSKRPAVKRALADELS